MGRSPASCPLALILSGALALGLLAAPGIGLASPLGGWSHQAGAKKKKHRRCARRHARNESKSARRHVCEKAKTKSRQRKKQGAVTPPGPVASPLVPRPAPVTPAPPAPKYRSVSARAAEFSITLSRPIVAAGAVTFQFQNAGEDTHDLVVSPEGTHDRLVEFGAVGPDLFATRTPTLPAGRYDLWCSLPGHEQLGMRATLRVE